MDETLIIRVDPRFPGAWDSLVPYIKEALGRSGAYRDWLEDDVLRAVIDGRCALWALVHNQEIFGAVVSSEIYYPKRKVIDVTLMGTEPNTEAQWLVCVETFKRMAKAAGADCLTATGRQGWSRKLGADRERIVFEIDLGD
jgi:hypothetical protein